MFPDTDFNIENESTQAKTSLGKVSLFDFDTNKHVLKDGKLVMVEKNEAIKKFVIWTLRTIIRRYKIYSEDYGVDYSFRFRKLPTGFVNSEIKRQLKEQLTQHIHIIDVTDFRTEREGTTLIVFFTLVTKENENIVFAERLVMA